MKKIFIFILTILFCSIVFAQNDIDQFGGWTKLKSSTRYSITGNSAESVTGLTLTDTGAFTGYNLKNRILQPNVTDTVPSPYSKYTYFLIKYNTDDTIYVEPCDRLDDDVITNGDMELDSNWSDYNTPTTNERSSFTYFDDYSRHVVGDSADDGIQQTGLTIQGDRVGHDDDWTGEYRAIGYVYTVNGTVYMRISDNDGVLYNARVGSTTGKWEDFETANIVSNYEGTGTGSIEFYCYGGACEFYIDDIVLGEYGYSTHNDYVGLDDFNNGTDKYATYGGWRSELIDNRWWIIDPLDNVFFYKGINKFNGTAGYDYDGITLCTHLQQKYGAGNCGQILRNKIPDLKLLGFNLLGIDYSVYVVPDSINYSIYELIPYMPQVRVSSWNFSDVGEIKTRNGTLDNTWVDSYDSDWRIKFNDYPNGVFTGVAGWGFGGDENSFRQSWNAWDVTPYKKRYLYNSANIWLVGYNLDEEPKGSASYGHLGYYIFCSSETDTTADDGINDSKRAFVNWLRAKYTGGDETTFVNNITYDGDDETVSVSGWATSVSGYDTTDSDSDGTPDKDEIAITNLNSAWGTTYPTQRNDGNNAWLNVVEEDGDNDFGLETQSGCSASDSSCTLESGCDSEIKNDMDELHGNYARKYMEPFWTLLFSDNGYFKGNKINFGIGVAKYIGWAKGLTSIDKTIKYSQVMAGRGVGGSGGSIFEKADESPFPPQDSKDIYINMYDESGIPIIHESVWVTGEADSQFGLARGTIDKVYKLSDSDYAVYTGGYINFSGTKITEDSNITWNSEADTGTLFWQFENSIDTPENEDESKYDDRYIIITDSGSIGNLEDGDIITDGTNSFTISGDPERISMIVDEDANFDTNYNNPRAYDNFFYWTVLVDEDDPPPVMYYQTAYGLATNRSLVARTNFENGLGYGAKEYTKVNVGDRYHMNFIFQYGNDWHDKHYELDTQEKRANMYINILKQSFEMKGSDNNYFDVGFAHWALWDYGFATYKSAEVRNFGFYTVKDNLYDGSEATTLGADGIAGTLDDEERDYGNFIKPMKQYLNNIYQELRPKYRISGGRIQ